MIPAWQMILGVCVGLVALVLTRRQVLNYGEHASDNDGRSRARQGRSSDSSYKQKFNSAPGDACIICLEEMQNENMTYLRCGHALHDKCFGKCKLYTDLCPFCRQSM
ncbi:uncharacterized protein LOC128871608 [Anastrepha ludens]|uniref:uncharacterized protein LOC128871608 n=1 Tax=Anastrepha ludens TaxID=28586 RepID=UPI0023B1AE68|nr:uncharacterized protein LOC128871608 [Anastrepha ludens]